MFDILVGLVMDIAAIVIGGLVLDYILTKKKRKRR